MSGEHEDAGATPPTMTPEVRADLQRLCAVDLSASIARAKAAGVPDPRDLPAGHPLRRLVRVKGKRALVPAWVLAAVRAKRDGR